MGIKVSNLLTVSDEEEEQICRILNGTGIYHYCLYRRKNKTIYFLFRIKELEAYLQELDVKYVLEQWGYRDLSIQKVIEKFQEHYEAYMRHGRKFPHEIGLLLGYPIEDVKGFVDHKGSDYLYAGYWKVYADVEEKKLLFDAFENAKEGVLLLVANGYSIRSILEYFRDNNYDVVYAKEFETALELKR